MCHKGSQDVSEVKRPVGPSLHHHLNFLVCSVFQYVLENSQIRKKKLKRDKSTRPPEHKGVKIEGEKTQHCFYSSEHKGSCLVTSPPIRFDIMQFHNTQPAVLLLWLSSLTWNWICFHFLCLKEKHFLCDSWLNVFTVLNTLSCHLTFFICTVFGLYLSGCGEAFCNRLGVTIHKRPISAHLWLMILMSL